MIVRGTIYVCFSARFAPFKHTEGAERKRDGGVDGEGAGVDQEGDEEGEPDVGLWESYNATRGIGEMAMTQCEVQGGVCQEQP